MKRKKILARFLFILFVGLLWLNISSASAQKTSNQESEKAIIVLDGKSLFKVGSIENFTAQERAELINGNLVNQVNSLDPLKLEVFIENEHTVIRNISDDQHILNVTRSDVISGTTIDDQAQVWKETLEDNLKQARKERSSSYVFKHILTTFLVIISAIIFNIFVYFANIFLLRKLASLLKNPNSPIYNLETPVQIILDLTIFVLQIGIWFWVFFYISDVFPLFRRIRYLIYQSLDSNIFNLGASKYSAIDLLFLLILTIGLWLFIRIITVLFKHNILSKSGANRALQDVITTIIQYVLSFFGIIILWQIWGFDVSSLAILVSVLGVGIGFGMQNIANNFISGLIITIERPIQIGDFIQVGDWQGKVQKIGSRSTVIKTMDKVSIIIPNSRFLDNDVINWNYDDPVSRLRIPIGVAYNSQIKKVRFALLEAVKSHPDVLLTPRPQVWLQEFGDSSLNFEICVWIREPAKQFQLKSELNYRIVANLYRHKIEIPYPQFDFNLRSSKLEKMIEIWLKKQGIDSEFDQEEIEDMDTGNFLSYIEDKLTEETIDDLVIKIRGQDGIEIKDRRYRLNIYKSCFIGSELVNWLVTNYDYSREQATELGQILVEQKIIHHVADEHPFMDEYFFYRFYEDEQG